jgi:hypothetical protein
MSRDEERQYIRDARDAVMAATGRSVAGWFGPERGQTSDTPLLLREEGFAWFGEWPLDERPVELSDGASGIVALSHPLEAEDMFSLYTRGLSFLDYERLLNDSIDQLLADAEVVGARHLGLSWFGWVLGQASFAAVAERVLARLVHHPDVLFATPGQVAALPR